MHHVGQNVRSGTTADCSFFLSWLRPDFGPCVHAARPGKLETESFSYQCGELDSDSPPPRSDSDGVGDGVREARN